MSRAINIPDQPGNLPRPSVKDSRVLTYLGNDDVNLSVNNAHDNELVQLWRQKYLIAKIFNSKS